MLAVLGRVVGAEDLAAEGGVQCFSDHEIGQVHIGDLVVGVLDELRGAWNFNNFEVKILGIQSRLYLISNWEDDGYEPSCLREVEFAGEINNNFIGFRWLSSKWESGVVESIASSSDLLHRADSLCAQYDLVDITHKELEGSWLPKLFCYNHIEEASFDCISHCRFEEVVANELL